MKISSNIPQQLSGLGSDKPVANTKKTAGDSPQTSSASSDDSVKISQSGVDMNKIEQSVSSSDGIDREKIEAVKAALKQGDYPFDANKIAEKIISMEGLFNS